MEGTEELDLVSYVFGGDVAEDERIYVEAADPAKFYTTRSARTTVRQLIAGLQAAGLKRGDCVCIHAFNHITYPLLFLAIVGAGGVFSGINPAYTDTELHRHLVMTQAKFLISEPDLLSRSYVPLPADNIFVFETDDQLHDLPFRSWRHLLMFGECDWLKPTRSTTAALLSTSGTSGLPKAAMVSHHSLIAQCAHCDDSHMKPFSVSRLVALPVFHAFAFPLAHLSPLRKGVTTYMMRRMDLVKFLEYLRILKITETAIVPPIVTSILKSHPSAYRSLRTLRTVWCAGAPLARGPSNAFFRLLSPTARLLQVWGMTEAGWITTFLWPERDFSGSVGRVLPGMEARIVHDGQVVDNQPGELQVRGKFIMQGYLDNPEATRAIVDSHGWLRTGDLGYQNEGRVYVVDRQKELIKVRGWQVSPAEIEAQLLLHPAIQDAAVIGIAARPAIADDEEEVPRAYISLRPGATLDEHDVKTYTAQHLAKYKALDGGVRFVNVIPKSSTGKILRRNLQRLAAAEVSGRPSLSVSITAPEYVPSLGTDSDSLTSASSRCTSVSTDPSSPTLSDSVPSTCSLPVRTSEQETGVACQQKWPPFLEASAPLARTRSLDRANHEAYMVLTQHLHQSQSADNPGTQLPVTATTF